MAQVLVADLVYVLAALSLYPLQDTSIIRNGRMDMLELKKFSEFKKIILLGYRFAQRLHEEGEFERFDVRGVSKLHI
jgi:hypothetical protein